MAAARYASDAQRSPAARGLSAAVAVRDRHAAVAAERLGADLDARRVLPALVLGEVDEPDDAGDVLLRETPRHELVAAQVVLDVALEDAVEDRVRRQGVLVALVVAQL